MIPPHLMHSPNLFGNKLKQLDLVLETTQLLHGTARVETLQELHLPSCKMFQKSVFKELELKNGMYATMKEL